MYRRRLVDITRIYGCSTHNSPIHPSNKVSSLHWRLQILPVHCLTLQYCYSFSRVHQGSKELKLMALAEGWLMTTNSKQSTPVVFGYPTTLVHRDHLQWWTTCLICKEYSPLLQKEHSLLPFADTYLRFGVLT